MTLRMKAMKVRLAIIVLISTSGCCVLTGRAGRESVSLEAGVARTGTRLSPVARTLRRSCARKHLNLSCNRVVCCNVGAPLTVGTRRELLASLKRIACLGDYVLGLTFRHM